MDRNSKKRTPDVVPRALAETLYVRPREVFEVQVLVRHYLCPFLIPMVTKWQNKFIVLSCYSSFVDLIFKKLWIYKKIIYSKKQSISRVWREHHRRRHPFRGWKQERFNKRNNRVVIKVNLETYIGNIFNLELRFVTWKRDY